MVKLMLLYDALKLYVLRSKNKNKMPSIFPCVTAALFLVRFHECFIHGVGKRMALKNPAFKVLLLIRPDIQLILSLHIPM
jgi:hypothetical protein